MEYSFRNYCHFVAPSWQLELARFSALLIVQDGAECGNKKNIFLWGKKNKHEFVNFSCEGPHPLVIFCTFCITSTKFVH